MKDYITQPDRVVNVKNALEATVTPASGGLRIGAAMKMVDVAEHADIARLYPAIAAAAIEVGTPQIRNQGTVGGNLNQRPRCWYFRNEEFVCFKKGGNTVLLARGREPVPRDPRRRTELHRPSVEPGGAVGRLRRDVPPARPEGRAAGAGGGVLHAADAQNVRAENVLAPERAADARDPAGARAA